MDFKGYVFQKIESVLSFAWVDEILKKLLSIILISIIMYIVIRIGNKLIKKFVDRQVASKTNFSLDPQKAKQ